MKQFERLVQAAGNAGSRAGGLRRILGKVGSAAIVMALPPLRARLHEAGQF